MSNEDPKNLVEVDFVRGKRITRQDYHPEEYYELVSDGCNDQFERPGDDEDSISFITDVSNGQALMQMEKFSEAAEIFKKWSAIYPEAMFFRAQCFCFEDLNNKTKIHSGLLLAIRALIRVMDMCKEEGEVPKNLTEYLCLFYSLLDIGYNVGLLRYNEINGFPLRFDPAQPDLIITGLRTLRGLLTDYLKFV